MSLDSHQHFLSELLGCQRSLYTYLYKLTLDPAAAQELLQEVNLVMLAKRDEYPRVANFGGWAARIAYLQLLAYRKRQQRERARLSPALVELLADEGAAIVQSQDPRLEALGHCLAKLSRDDRKLVDERYLRQLRAGQIAELVNRSAHAVSQALYRIRTALGECIRNRLAGEEV